MQLPGFAVTEAVVNDEKRAPHYLTRLSSSSRPRRYLYVDTETFARDDVSHETHTFRIASAITERWSKRLGEWIRSDPVHFEDATTLWQFVSKFSIKSNRTVMWCHNLGFDLRISDAFDILPELGWRFDVVRMNDEVSWCRCVRKRDGATLLLCDTFAWLPMSLESIAHLMGTRKQDLPDMDDMDVDKWFARCDSDVTITADAWGVIRDWLDDIDAPWRFTAPSQAWSIWRKDFLNDKVLVHDDVESLSAERTAAYAGRAESFWNGTVKGRFEEWDFRHAYAAICAMASLPVRRRTPFTSAPYYIDQAYSYMERGESAFDLGCNSESVGLVRCEVQAALNANSDVDVPVLPIRQIVSGGRVIWPVGHFESVWWLPELLAAEQAGQLQNVTIKAVSWYDCSPVLANWGRWVIEQIECDAERGRSAVIAQVAKHMSRTIVGRFGMMVSDYVKTNTMSFNDVSSGWLIDGSDSRMDPRRMMQIGDQVYVESEKEEATESVPQVMSYVMMLTRLRLLEAITAAGGLPNVVYCDTDGLIVTPTGARLLSANPDVVSGALRRKATYSRLTLFGPKQLMLDNRPRIAGLPFGASRPSEQNSDGSWNVTKFERTRASMESGRASEVRVANVSVHPIGRDGRRSKPTDGVITGPISV